MKGDLSKTLHDAVKDCGAFLFFITDGILDSKWCAQEIRWAVQYKKIIILVRETDERHGGIDMKDFFKQVPSDLMETFQNIIAIPWYREPAYRDISVKSILKAAQLEDTHAEDMRRMSQTREQLEALSSSPSLNMTAIECISKHSVPLMIVFFMGGFWRPRTKILNRIYVVIFNISFWLCGMLCLTNIIYKAVPYHVFSTDFLTAYVHLPAWQGWRIWRKYVLSHQCKSLLARIFERPDFAEQVAFVCKVAGWLILIVQMAMVCVVLAGFSLPNTLRWTSLDTKEWLHAHSLGDYVLLETVHAGIMWFIIPPVTASMFASYSMFAFVSVLHLLDVEILKETLRDCAHIVARFQRNMRRKKRASEDDDASSESSSNHSEHMHLDVEQLARMRTVEEHLYDNVFEIIGMLAHQTQRRIDDTCSFCGWVWLHLVLFSTVQVLAICNGFRFHSSRMPEQSTWDSYEWWWAFQDFFHLGGGLVLLGVAFGLFCLVKASFDMVPEKADELFLAARASRVLRVDVQGSLRMRSFGMHVMGATVYIDTPKAFLFFVFLLIVVLDHTLALLNELDFGRSMT